MEARREDNTEWVKHSLLYKEYSAELEEILSHKWIESEKAGYDIGFERALVDWHLRYRSVWRAKRKSLCSCRAARTQTSVGNLVLEQAMEVNSPREQGLKTALV